jgi:dTMP kinase
VRGALITFEGADGSGKTSQMRRLAGRLAALSVQHEVTREPGGTTAGRAIRALLLEERTPPLVPDAELLLYAADRAQHVRETLRPAVEAGRVVLCDRYTDATVAYQGYGRGLDLELIAELNRLATGGLVPDLTVLLDVDVDEAARRMQARAAEQGAEAPTRFDLEAREFHERVRRGYLAIAASDPVRVRVVDARGTFDDVAARVDRVVAECLSGQWPGVSGQ